MSRTAGAAEIFREIGGVVEDPEDIAAFAAILERLAEPGERERWGAAARRVAEAHAWDAHVAALREQLRRAAP